VIPARELAARAVVTNRVGRTRTRISSSRMLGPPDRRPVM
jgi:hypothetical protein